MNARLLQRTTRKLSLTDVGRTYYDYCARIAGEIEDAERAVSSLQATPRGLLRVTAPINIAFLGPIVSDYLARYPEVRLELFCTTRRGGPRRGAVRPRHPRRHARRLDADRAQPRQRELVPRRDPRLSQEAGPSALTGRSEASTIVCCSAPARRTLRLRERRPVGAGRRVATRLLVSDHGHPRMRRPSPVSASRCFRRINVSRICAPAGSSACFATGTRRRRPFTSCTRARATSRPR